MEVKNYITPEEYQKKLLDQFNGITKDDIVQLIRDSKLHLIQLKYSDDLSDETEQRVEFIKSIIEFCEENRNITFKQWKALNAFCLTQQKENLSKQF